MSRTLMVQWTCDGAACGKVTWTELKDYYGPPTLPDGWVGTTKVAFCPDHVHLIHSHREPASVSERAETAGEGS